MTNSMHPTRNTATAESRSTHTQRTTVPRIIGAVAAIALLASGCGSRSAAEVPLTADTLTADNDNDTGVVLAGESRSRSDLRYTIIPLDDTTDPIGGTTAESTSPDRACPLSTSAPNNDSLVTIGADGSLIPVDAPVFPVGELVVFEPTTID